MATKQRAQSSTGFYHVFHRGVNQFDIFEDDEDRQYYRDHLQKYARDLGVEVHAWCLMSNHSHLLLKADHEALPVFMRQLASSYARFFNRRHARSGPLFEGRFDSVCIESDEQLISVVRYIHRNPVHHEEETLFGTYPWSSFREYATGAPELCEIAFALELFGGIDSFVAYHEGWDENERHLDMDTLGRMGDDEARRRADSALESAGFKVKASSIGRLPRKLRDKALMCVKRAVNCSLRQLQRLTSIAYSAIRNAVAPGREGQEGSMEGEAAPSPKAELHASLAFAHPKQGDRKIASSLPSACVATPSGVGAT